MLAHLTVNGASVRPGDLFASGTVSGPSAEQWGCLLELTRGGAVPLPLADGSQRSFLADGDEVVISASGARRPRSGPNSAWASVRGRIGPAHLSRAGAVRRRRGNAGDAWLVTGVTCAQRQPGQAGPARAHTRPLTGPAPKAAAAPLRG